MATATAARPKTGTRKLSEVVRVPVVKPTGITSTGWPRVEKVCREKLGVRFDRWQDGAGRVILAQREDGRLAATIGGVGMSLPRQVGKTYLLAGLIFGLCIDRPGLLVIWSAHHSRTHGETFLAMQAFANRAKVSPYIEQVFKGSGDEEIRFHNGSRILFGARERGFGRGVPGVDVMVCDEAQILSDKALEDMLATLNTSQFGLALYVGTPPKPEDNSESFARMRAEALSGEADDLVWIECGADHFDDPDDPKTWAKANPSYPHRTPDESILRLQRKLTGAGFRREGLGIWNELTKDLTLVPADMWGDRLAEDPPAQDSPPATIGVDRSPDGTTSIAGAWRTDDATHVELLAVDAVMDTAGVVDWLAERAGRKIPVLIAADSPAAAMAPDLIAKRVKVKLIAGVEFARSCQAFVDDAIDGPLTHAGQQHLDDALAAATKLPYGKAGLWVWNRRSMELDISALVAATVARGGVAKARKKADRSGAVYQRR